jgi:integrase
MRLASAIEEFVKYRQSLGSPYKGESSRLKAFLRQTGDVELKDLRVDHTQAHLPLADGTPVTSGWFKKYETLNRFCRYAQVRGYLQNSVLPTPPREKPRAFVPYIYSIDDMRRLLGVPDSQHSPKSPLTPYTMRTFLLLLYGTGMRLGEAIKLTFEDINLDDALLTVRGTKFNKSRLVPVGRDVASMLRLYGERQWTGKPHDPDMPFLRTRLDSAVKHSHADHQFSWLRMEAGVLRFDNARYQPRLHDFRHTFAVNRIVAWYREGKDVQRLLPQLCTYLGHVSIDETAHYLRMTRDLLQEANNRFEQYSIGEVRHA